MNVYAPELAERLQMNRKSKGVSLRRAAKEIGTYLSALQKLEKGLVSKEARTKKEAIAKFYDIPLEEYERLIEEALPPSNAPSNFLILKLLARSDSDLEDVTREEALYLRRLFFREGWKLPEDCRALVTILELYRVARPKN